MKKPSILIVDDDPVTANMILEALGKESYEIAAVHSGMAAMEAGRSQKFDLVLTDLKMRDADGLVVLEWFRKEQPKAIILLMTAFGSSGSAIDAIQQGAYDYISKPFKIDELRSVIRKALSVRAVPQASFMTSEPEELESLIGRSKKMIEVYKMIGRVADADAVVLIIGETGSGKELIAEALHQKSYRRNRRFLAVNCSAFTETLLEAELFGHEKGAFTGAVASRPGIFEAASGGTVFLDEISETSPAMQTKLLRVLQNKEIKRVGSNQSAKVDARIIGSSNKDLRTMVESGEFRQDLYFRLNGITIVVPPLRERMEDLPELIQHFIRKYSPAERKMRLSQEAYDALLNYDWPGNIRELEHVIQRAITLTPVDTILREHLNLDVGLLETTPTSFDFNEQVSLDELEKRYISYTYLKTGRNKAKSAEILGIDRKTLYSKLAKYGIENSKDQEKPS